MPPKRPFTFSSQAPTTAPPRPKPRPLLPEPSHAGSARSHRLLANSAKLLAAQPPAPPPKPRHKPPPRKPRADRPPPRPDPRALLTRENAAAALRRAAAAPVVATDHDDAAAVDDWRRDDGPAKPARPATMPGFYGSAAERAEAAAAARGDRGGPSLDEGLAERLRPHQLEAVAWLCARLWKREGCVLADEMGLGKTAACLATLGVLCGVEGAARRATQRAFRVVVACPAGVAHTWAAEAAKWLVPPPLAAARAQAGGPRHVSLFTEADVAGARALKRRKRVAERLEARSRRDFGDDADGYEERAAARGDDDAVARFAACPLEEKPVLIISYESFRAKAARLRQLRDVGLLICDEAHRLKGGEHVEVWRAVADDRAPRRLLVTATPVQNGVAELRALLELAGALAPGADEAALRAALRDKTLRREVADVRTLALPPKRDVVVTCRASAKQRALHETHVAQGDGTALARLGRARHLLSAPSHIDENLDDLDACGKWAFCTALLDACRARGERVVLVSQYAAPLKAARRLAETRGWPAATIDGATHVEARRDAQDALNDPAEDLFLLCLALRAGGVGLTLTGASRLVLFEPSWNPADDDQAVARVWRWGQTREARIYRLATPASIEEAALRRQGAKRGLAGRVAHVQKGERLLETARLEAAFDEARAAQDRAEELWRLGEAPSGGVDAAAVAADPALAAACAATVDGRACVVGVRGEGADASVPVLQPSAADLALA